MNINSWKENELVNMEANMEIDDEKREEYKGLLNRRMALEKEAAWLDIEYMQKFGELIEKIMKLKIECIKYKKILALYFRMKNMGKQFDAQAAMFELARELGPYYQELENLQKMLNDKGKTISKFALNQIKKIYKEIVNLIHPDIAPELYENETIQNLWNEATINYKCNKLEKLQEIYFLILDELEKIGYDTKKKINIENIDEKIAIVKEEIEDILNTNPYQYKFLLEDKLEVLEKQDELRDEVENYENYLNELTTEVSSHGIDVKEFDVI